MNIVQRQEAAGMLYQWKEQVDLRAAGAICPMLCCRALVIAYEAADSLNEITRPATGVWDFVCSACGTEFSATTRDLLFQSVPRAWLFSEVCHA